jgi:hypothetical protein
VAGCQADELVDELVVLAMPDGFVEEAGLGGGRLLETGVVTMPSPPTPLPEGEERLFG